MPKMVYDEWYGDLTYALRTQIRAKNVPPALYDELVDYFGAGNFDAMTAYLKAKPRSMNYGEVYRDRPDQRTGKILERA